MTELPLVSVLMTSYNREKYIAEAIDSVLDSTYSNFELIIVDDVSLDNTVAIARNYEKKDNRVKVYINEINLGDYPNRNQAASYATGEYIMYVDSDDKLLRNGIENIMQVLQKHPEANFGICTLHEIGEEPKLLKPEDSIYSHFFKFNFLTVGPGGTILKREFFNSINKYPVKYGPANDQYFNLKVTTNSAIVTLPFEFLFYRRHEGQEINNRYSYLYNNYKYLRDAIVELNLPLDAKTLHYLNNKNKRRFLINIFKYFLKTLNLKKTIYAIKQAQFSASDFKKALIH